MNQQLNKRRLSLLNPVSVLCILVLFFMALPSYALSSSDRTVGKNESYTITYRGGAKFRLQEKVGTNGKWKFLSRSSTGKKTFTKSVANTYYYRTYRIGCGGRSWGKRRGRGGGCNHVSKPISVSVLPGPPISIDTLDVQQQYQFETRVGDINFDGRKDIYIRRLSGNANNGVISQTILIQNSNRTFKIYNASSSQLAKAKSWSKVNIVTALEDFNLDGYIDVFLKGVSGAISNTKDQLVFSSGIQYNTSAQVVTNIDDNFKKTFSSVANWIVDEDYFKDNLITRYKWIFYPVAYWNPRTDRWEWHWVPGRIKYQYYDRDVITKDAVKIKNALFDILKIGEIKAGSKDAKALSKTLEQSLGVSVFNNALTIQGLPLPYEDDKYLENARLLRLLSRLLNLASLILTPGNEGSSAFYINHYTGTRGKAGILRSGYVRQSEDGYAYFTKDVYDSGTRAKSRLALNDKPTGFFIFNEDEMGGFFEPPRKVKPAFGEKGGGIEIRHRGDAYYDSWRWIPIK